MVGEQHQHQAGSVVPQGPLVLQAKSINSELAYDGMPPLYGKLEPIDMWLKAVGNRERSSSLNETGEMESETAAGEEAAEEAKRRKKIRKKSSDLQILVDNDNGD